MGILENTSCKDVDARLRRSLYLRWHNMHDRCYNPSHPRFSQYGGNGITVCVSWKNFEVFFNDAFTLPGFDKNKILEGGMFLDKDSRMHGNKLYSKDTCCFISSSESNKYIPSRMKPFIGIDQNGIEYESSNQTFFATQYNLRQSTIADCLKGRVVKHKGWTFRYKE